MADLYRHVYVFILISLRYNQYPLFSAEFERRARFQLPNEFCCCMELLCTAWRVHCSDYDIFFTHSSISLPFVNSLLQLCDCVAHVNLVNSRILVHGVRHFLAEWGAIWKRMAALFFTLIFSPICLSSVLVGSGFVVALISLQDDPTGLHREYWSVIWPRKAHLRIARLSRLMITSYLCCSAAMAFCMQANKLSEIMQQTGNGAHPT